MYEKPKCTCGENLEFDMNVDIRVDEAVATLVNHGYCPKCNKKYNWLDYYIISHYSHLEEDIE